MQHLPDVPKIQSPESARKVIFALDSIWKTEPDMFRDLFGPGTGLWKEDFLRTFGPHFDDLRESGLLIEHQIDGLSGQPPRRRLQAPFLVSPWNGAFYLTDYPDTEQQDEVFSPHPEQKFFTQLLQTRAGDEVLDLGTGSGILLLEAVRRGARGLGIDISDRALAFARANASLNGLEARVRFDKQDMTVAPKGNEWGQPNVIICNPPFEPIPDGCMRPRHSDAGDHGIEVLEKMLTAVAEFAANCPKLSLFQLVLFSLGGKSPKGFCPPRGVEILESFTQKTSSEAFISELLRPIRLEDYLVLNFEGGRHGLGGPWLERLENENYRYLHLLFASINFHATECKTHFSTFESSGQTDECFVLPYASQKRSAISRGDTGETGIFTSYLDQLVEAREQSTSGRTINLGLDEKKVQAFLRELIQSESLFSDVRPLVLVDVRSRSSKLGIAVLNRQDKFEYFRKGLDELVDLLREIFKQTEGAETLLALNFCDAVSEKSKIVADRFEGTDHISWHSETCTIETVPKLIQHGDDLAFVQRFVVVGPKQSCLTPTRQRLFANLLSEMAGVADSVSAQRALENYSLAHPLKHRVGYLARRIEELRVSTDANGTTTDRVHEVESLVKHLSKFSELLNMLFYALKLGYEDTLEATSNDKLRFAANTPLRLQPLLDEVASNARSYGVANNQRVELTYVNDIGEVNCFYSYGTKSPQKGLTAKEACVRPADFFYEEILYEIITNSLKHGEKNVVDKGNGIEESYAKVVVRLEAFSGESEGNLPMLVFSGTFWDSGATDRWDEPQENWLEWKNEGPTGLTFLNAALKNTNSGRLYFRHAPTGERNRKGIRRTFDVGVCLQGLVLPD